MDCPSGTLPELSVLPVVYMTIVACCMLHVACAGKHITFLVQVVVSVPVVNTIV